MTAKSNDPFEVELDNWLSEMLDEETVPSGTSANDIAFPKKTKSNFDDLRQCCCGAEVAKTTHTTYCPKYRSFK